MHDKASSQQLHKVQDIVVCTCTVCGKVHTLKSIEVKRDLDGSRSQDSWLPKNHQVYPGLPRFIHWKGVISVVRGAVLSVRRDARDGLGGLAMARGHSCRSRFEEFPAAIANWCSSMKFNPASYDIFIFFCLCSILSSSTGSMGIGAPDRSSRFQWMLYVAFPSSKFPWSSRVVISGASLSWSTQHVLLKHPVLEFIHVFDICRGDSSWTPMSQCEWEKCFYALNHHLSNSAMRILINSYRFYVLKGVSSGVSSAQATRPWIWWERSARRNSWTCWWTKPLGRTGGPQALQWPKDVNFNGYNMVKLLALVGMKAVFKWREIVIFVRTRGCLCCECWTNLKSVHGAKSSSQVLPISEHRST